MDKSLEDVGEILERGIFNQFHYFELKNSPELQQQVKQENDKKKFGERGGGTHLDA